MSKNNYLNVINDASNTFFKQEPRYKLFLLVKPRLIQAIDQMVDTGILESTMIYIDQLWSLVRNQSVQHYGILQSLFYNQIVTTKMIRKETGVSIPSILGTLDRLERVGLVQKVFLADLGQFGLSNRTHVFALNEIEQEAIKQYAFANYKFKEPKEIMRKQCDNCLVLYRKGKEECPSCGCKKYHLIGGK